MQGRQETWWDQSHYQRYNLVMQVSFRAKNNLNLFRFLLKHKVSTGRVEVATDITLDNVRLLRELKESKK